MTIFDSSKLKKATRGRKHYNNHILKKQIGNIFIVVALLALTVANPVSAQDISDKALNKKQNLEDFYRSELRKGTLADERRADYTKKLEELRTEIKDIREQRMRNAERQKDTDPTLVEAEKFDVQFREIDIALVDSAPPMILANEPKSLIFNAGVSFLSLKTYSAPFTISAEKVLSEKISVGGYFGHLLEKIIDSTNYLDSNAFFTANKANYKHTYLNFGVKASYHFFKPTFVLPPTKFDPYITAMLGYTIKTGTHPFLKNEEFLPYDADNNTVDPGDGKSAFLHPEKSGLNFGVFGGLRYMHDDHLGFFVEAGYANTAFATIGATVRFLDKSTAAGKESQVVHFKVKIVSSERKKKEESKSFKGRTDMEEYETKDGFIYVLTGKSTSFEDATDLQVELSGGDFRRAEVVAIKMGRVIKLSKGKKLMGIVVEEPEVEEDPFEKEEEEKESQVVHFKVKIVSSERKKKQESKSFKGRTDMEEYETKDGFIYVLTGKSTSFEDATDLQVELSGGDFRRAEVVAIKMGRVIKLSKGKKLMGIVDEEPEVEDDPFEKEEEEEVEEEKDKKKKKKKKNEEGDEEDNEEDK